MVVEKNIKNVMGNKGIKKSKFKLKPGQVDYTNIKWAPVINCVLKFEEKFLIVQRSKELNFYPEHWNGISGFLDDDRSFNQKVEDEIEEELGIKKEDITFIEMKEIFHQDAPKYNKTWIVHPVLVGVKTNKIVMDWEAQDYKWISLEDIGNFDLLPGFDMVLEKLFSNYKK